MMITKMYFITITSSLLLQGFVYYGMSYKFGKDFSIGVIVVAYILALIFNIIGGEYLGLNYFLGAVMFAILPSYVIVSFLSIFGKKIDDISKLD